MVTRDLYSNNFNLLMLNVWIGMCKGVKGLPRDLRMLGYQDYLIEYAFTNSDGSTVVPELVIGSEKVKHAVLLESKKGANTDTGQLDRYLKVTQHDLTTKAFLPIAVSGSHDVCLVGKEEHKDRLKIGLGRYPFPLLIVRPDAISLELNNFKRDQLNRVFVPKLEISLTFAPTSFVPFNEESEDWEVAEKVIPYVIQQMFRREATILLEDACHQLITGWTRIAPDKKPQFRQKIALIFNEACKNEFRRFLQRTPGLKTGTRTQTWQIRNNPLDMSSHRRSREFKKLKSLQRQFIDALRTGRRTSVQEELFDNS